MKQFIFNPEHDMCLADGSGSFIPPAAIVEFARRCRWIERFMGDGVETSVVPWGWNRCLRERLLKDGVPAELMPDDEQLDFIRKSSRRELALELLEYLHKESGGSVDECPAGYRIAACSMAEIEAFLQEKGRVVLKAPLSGSGKGVRFVTGELMETDRGWCKRTLQRQGAVIVEQRMEIVKEFAMLFEVTGGMRKGTQEEMPQVLFRGYSLFYASNGAYKGNVLASNEYIEKQLDQYVPVGELRRVRSLVERFLQEKLQGKYVGFVGVDQFVAECSGVGELSGRKYLWNPAMELNLRMTMGLVARNIYDFHKDEFQLGEGTHCFEPERGVFPVDGSQPYVE